jgi:hypothetical protein
LPADSAVTTASTPGEAFAAAMSIERMRPLAMPLVSTYPYAARGATSLRS